MLAVGFVSTLIVLVDVPIGQLLKIYRGETVSILSKSNTRKTQWNTVDTPRSALTQLRVEPHGLIAAGIILDPNAALL